MKWYYRVFNTAGEYSARTEDQLYLHVVRWQIDVCFLFLFLDSRVNAITFHMGVVPTQGTYYKS